MKDIFSNLEEAASLLTTEQSQKNAQDALILIEEFLKEIPLYRINRDLASKIIGDLFSLSNPWPFTDVFNKLIEGNEILLKNKNYDGHGWEEINTAYLKAKEIQSSMADTRNQLYKESKENTIMSSPEKIEYIEVCNCDKKTPLIWTFRFPGAEYWCPKCGNLYGMFGCYFSLPATDELKKIKQEWEEKAKPFLLGDTSTWEYEQAN